MPASSLCASPWGAGAPSVAEGRLKGGTVDYENQLMRVAFNQ